MKYELVIFDLDGTLLNTIEDLGAAVDYAMKSKGFATHTVEEYRSMVGHGIRNLVTSALPEAFRLTPIIDACLAQFITYYKENIDVHTEPYPGIKRMLKQLSKQGVKLAVASNKFQEGTQVLLDIFFPQIRFASVYGNREGVPLKPDAEVIRRICAETGIDAEHTTMVGDAGSDIKTAANAGVRSIGVSWGYRQASDLEGADLIVNSVEELRRALLK